MFGLRAASIILVSVFFTIGVVFAAPKDLVNYVEKALAQTKAGTIPPLPELKIASVKPMDINVLRNPFDMPVKLLAKDGLSVAVVHSKQDEPDLARRKTALEQVPLGDLKFSGVIEQAGQFWAIITNVKNQHVSMVQSGDYLGQDYGRIVEITAGYVKIDQRKQKEGGSWYKETTYLNLDLME
ncbi:pilus assembly protein PilP [Caedibacter taeniospiralis]|jgi:type IV pilus assembly protein PilP|uniref:pilus assembly protein PilP n=1 Tax=Caedibacter taeniospiralis TaxID=28907 RepID=UPI0037C151D8